MKNSKRLIWIAYLAIISAMSAAQTLQAATITGTFQVVEDIQVQQYDNATPVGNPVIYTDVPTVLNFTLTAYTPTLESGGYVQYSLANSVLYFNTGNLPGFDTGIPVYFTSIVDGTPGQSADNAFGLFESSVYHLYNAIALFGLFDPSGEFIGPNGDGNPSDVQNRWPIHL